MTTRLPLREGHFSGGSKLTDSGDGSLHDILNTVEDTKAATSKSRLDVWANGSTGNDSNDGLSAATPKKTLQAVFDLAMELAIIFQDDTIINLRGVFQDTGTPVLSIQNAGRSTSTRVLIDGGTETVVVQGPFTADISSISSIGYTGAGLTPDAMVGYWIEVLDGPAIGETRDIISNTGTTLVPRCNFTTNPGAATFQIVRPATTLAPPTSFILPNFSLCTGPIYIQNLYLQNTSYVCRMLPSIASLIMAGIVSENRLLSVQNIPRLTWHELTVDATTLAFDTVRRVGVSLRNPARTVQIIAIPEVFLSHYSVRALRVANCTVNELLTDGSRVMGPLTLDNCLQGSALGAEAIKNIAGYQIPRQDGASGVGLTVRNSDLAANGGILENNGSHAIDLQNSSLFINSGGLSGSGNGGAGLYAHGRSLGTIKNGSSGNITLTGTVGQVSTDGATQAGTWAAIDAGTPVVDATEQTVVQEVP